MAALSWTETAMAEGLHNTLVRIEKKLAVDE